MKVLKVAVVKFETLQFTLTKNGTVELFGFEGRLLRTILDALHVIPKLFIPLDYQWGTLKEDGNWTGMIGMVQRGEVDIALSLISQSYERMKAVDFSMAYAISDTTFVVKRPNLKSKELVILLPFSLNLWIVCFSFIFLYPLLIRLFLSTSSYSYLWLNTMGNILRQPSEIARRPWYNRIIQATWLFFAFTVSISYSAIMLSYLTLPLEGEAVKSFKELSEAVSQGKLDCYTVKGTHNTWMLLHSEDRDIKRLGELIVKNNWLVQLNDNSGLAMANGQELKRESTYINHRIILENKYGLRPDMRISKESLATKALSIAINKNFCCKQRLNDVLYKIVESGMYGKYVRDDALKSFLKLHYNSTFDRYKIESLKLHDLIGAFIILILGLVISCLVFIFEVCYVKSMKACATKNSK